MAADTFLRPIGTSFPNSIHYIRQSIRSAGILERYHTTRHLLGFDSCVVAAVKYTTQDQSTLTKDVLFPALREVIKAHPPLGVKLNNEVASDAAFHRLQTIDLSHVVQFSDDDDLQATLESQLGHGFDINADLPLWRIQVLNDNTVVFAIYHGIGDGLSSIAFHASLLQALRNDTAGNASSSVRIPDEIALSPPMEGYTSLRSSLCVFWAEVYKSFAPKPWTGAHSAWSGNHVPSAGSLKTNVRLMTFSPPDVAAFCTTCHAHRATLTSVFYALTVAIISRMVAQDSTRHKTISSGVALSLRVSTGIPRDAICDCVSAHFTYPPANPNFIWTDAERYAATLQKQKRKARENVGMLRFLFGNYVPYMRGHLGAKRASGFVLSNLGRFEAPVVDGTWNIVDAVFAQCDVVIGAAFKLNVVGYPIWGGKRYADLGRAEH
ncbi:alcohol acetyltransferase-domain-containing protein [Mycena crocata]|nr:alcohol acetyltransferase-domain-containing protein [Mycena crocata]